MSAMSINRMACEPCDGMGLADCPKCMGTGRLDCDEVVPEPCDYCAGGTIECPPCDGRGWREEAA